MAETANNNDLNPIDPRYLAAILLTAVAGLTHLTPDQVDVVNTAFGITATIVPFLPRGRR